MEQTLFTQFLLQFGKSSPLFLLIFLGFALSRWFGFNKTASTVLSKFAFNIALPAMLFRLLSNLALTESHADLRLLIAFFGACFILFFIGRFVSGYLLKMKPVETAIFGTDAFSPITDFLASLWLLLCSERKPLLQYQRYYL